ncbi:MAG: site-specific integrase [Paludibacteraceae bacterium]|nr:site-specific integrase [Paludibacteraceae bacterium]
MNISKLPSGSYRVRKTIDGVCYSVTLAYKPNKREAEQLIADKLQEKKMSRKAGKTFFDCAYDYIEIKRNILSPTTIKAYKSLLNNAFEDWFLKKDIEQIKMEDIQKIVNIYSANHAPKTTRNLNGFISAVFDIYRPSMDISTTLPQKVKNEAYIPSDDDVRRIFEFSKGSEYEIGLKLCAMGLRRSEMCALNVDDLDGNILTINKALVLDEFNHWVIKTTKTTESTRQIYISDELADAIRERGYIFNGYPNAIYKYLCATQDKLNIPHFSLHKLRHYFASSSHAIGIPDVYIMSAGGWRTDATLKSVYRHAMSDKNIEMQKRIADQMSKLYS